MERENPGRRGGAVSTRAQDVRALSAERVARALARELVGRADVHEGEPVQLEGDGLAHPDVCVLVASSVRLVAEVAVGALEVDHAQKPGLYAKAGIPELWVIDLGAELVEVHRVPSGDGYEAIEALGRGERVSPLAFPDVLISVDEILGE